MFIKRNLLCWVLILSRLFLPNIRSMNAYVDDGYV